MICVERRTQKKKNSELQKGFNKSSCLVLSGFSTEATVYFFFFFRFFNSLNPDIQSFFLKLVSKLKKKNTT